MVDAYRKETKKYTFTDYALFVTFFPQLVAGPIVLHDEIIPQFNDRTKHTVDLANIAKGLYILSIGLSKKVLLADTFGIIVANGYAYVAELTTADAIVVTMCILFRFISIFVDIQTWQGVLDIY